MRNTKKIMLCLLVICAFPLKIYADTPVTAYSYSRSIEIISASAYGNHLEATVKNTGNVGRYIRFEANLNDSGSINLFGRIQTVLRPNEQRSIDISLLGNIATSGKALFVTAEQADAQKKFYVSNSGNDANNGSLSYPFKTIKRAREEVKNLKYSNGLPYGGVTVYLRGGSYTEAVSFDEFDSGFGDSPIVYAAYNNEEVHIKGSNTIPASAFSSAGFSNANVLKADLKTLGITDFGEIVRSNAFTVASDNPSSTMLYVDGAPQTIARYPNAGALKTGAVTPAANGNYEHTIIFNHNITSFNPSVKWSGQEVWARGFWQWNWYEDALKVSVGASQVTLSERTAYGIKQNQDYYFFNILSELDAPGEFYIDRVNGFLYYYPAGNISDKNIELTFLKKPIISMKNTKNVHFEGFNIENSRFSGVFLENCENVVVEGLKIHGLGGQGVRIKDGKNCGVLSSDIHEIGRGGVRLEGGDRATLTPAGHFVENCDIYNFCLESATYTPAIYFVGVGSAARNNKIHEGPHLGIALSGNDHIIANNELYNLCQNSDDSGAIYGGRDWTQCGVVIKNNYFHDIYGKNGHGAHAVYFDDMMSGNTVSENIFYNVYTAVFMHGSRATTVKDNLIINADNSIWQVNIQDFNNYAAPGGTLRNNYNVIFTENAALQVCTPVSEAWYKYNGEPTSNYPLYRRLDKIPYDQPNYPKYNEFTGNTLYNSKNISYTAYAAESGNFTGNTVNGAALDINTVDMSEIGLYSDKWR